MRDEHHLSQPQVGQGLPSEALRAGGLPPPQLCLRLRMNDRLRFKPKPSGNHLLPPLSIRTSVSTHLVQGSVPPTSLTVLQINTSPGKQKWKTGMRKGDLHHS